MPYGRQKIMQLNLIIYIMGVSGAGKSTIGGMLSKTLDMPFFDGDNYHSEANVLKMAKGQALNDSDRFGWLQKLNGLAKEQSQIKGCIIACSALKESYRAILNKDIEKNTKWVFLRGSFDQIKERMGKRKNHFMKPNLLKSQFDALEEPKGAIHVSIDLEKTEIIDILKKELTKKSDFDLFGRDGDKKAYAGK